VRGCDLQQRSTARRSNGKVKNGKATAWRSEVLLRHGNVHLGLALAQYSLAQRGKAAAVYCTAKMCTGLAAQRVARAMRSKAEQRQGIAGYRCA